MPSIKNLYVRVYDEHNYMIMIYTNDLDGFFIALPY